MPGTAEEPTGRFGSAFRAPGSVREQTSAVAESDRPSHEMSLRVADADRDRTVTLLREHVVDGRLTLDEFSERVSLALQARTKGDLDGVLVDLPTLANAP